MPIEYSIISGYRGYVTKKDITNMSARLLTIGSQNVLINDEEKIESRKGFTLDGAANAALNPIESSFDWDTDLATEINTRSYDDELEFRSTTTPTDSTVLWRRIADAWSAVAFSYTLWWDTTEGRELLLFVNGDDNIYEWNGANAYLSATTTSTITITGSDTWAQKGFYTGRNKTLVINGTDYAYTGGETTTTLTGVTPDPTGEADDSFVIQKIVTNANKPGSDSTTFSNDIISTLNNQVYVGSNINNEIFVSKNSSFTDFTFSSPRLPGEGALLTLDSYGVGFAPQDEDMYITAGKNEWYKTKFTLSADTTAETLIVRKLKSPPQGAAISNDLVFTIKNNTAYISNEKTLDTLGRIENIDTPQTKPLSDSIKPDFIDADFTNGHGLYFRNQMIIARPVDNVLNIYDIEKGHWQPPQILPIRRLAIIGGELYGHSSEVPETYKLFDGRNDNDNPISFNATFSYRNFGRRANQKNFDEFFTEGYITSNTVLTLELLYNYKGSESILTGEIDGSDSNIVEGLAESASLGKESLGKTGLGTDTEAVEDLKKFRDIFSLGKVNFYEIQSIYTSDSADGNFSILAHGPNAQFAGERNLQAKK